MNGGVPNPARDALEALVDQVQQVALLCALHIHHSHLRARVDERLYRDLVKQAWDVEHGDLNEGFWVDL